MEVLKNFELLPYLIVTSQIKSLVSGYNQCIVSDDSKQVLFLTVD